MQKQPTSGFPEDFRSDFLDCWQRLPNKGFFFCLLAGWLALFQFLGNSTLGYINSPSLLWWMYLAYHPTEATDDGQGLWIPFVVLGLFWWKRRELLALELRTWTPALALVALGLVIHLVGYAVQQPKISIIGLFVGLYGLMGVAWGTACLRASFFPFILFAFCVPLGNQAQPISFPLRLLVCQLVGFICHFVLAIDIRVVGTALIDPTGQYQYEVAAACSGMRSLIATLAVAMIYAMLSFRTWWKRGALIASAVPLAVLGNVVRMLTIILAAEFGGQRAGNYVHQGGPFGLISLLPYVPAFAGLFLLGYWLRERPVEPALQLQAKPI
jgi:exosortase